MTSFGAILQASAKRHSDRVCLRDGQTVLTFDDTFDRASRLGGTLRSMGVQPGDRVLISMDNCWQGVVAVLGSLLAGAVVAPVNVGAKRRELMHSAALVEPTAIVAAAGPLSEFSACEGLGELTVLPGVIDGSDHGGGDLDFSDALYRGEVWDGATPHPSDPAFIMFTSGTTGLPKGVIRTHEVIARFLENWENRVVRSDDVVMNFLPLNHQAGLILSVLGPMYLGAQVVLLPRFTPAAFWTAAVDHKVTWTVTMPPVPGLLVGADALSRGGNHSLRSTLGAGAVKDWRAFEEFYDVEMITGYGSTESTMVTMSPSGRQAGACLDSQQGGSYCGAPLPGWTRIRVELNDGRLAGAGEAGQIQLSGGGLFSEYWNNADATARAFTHDGWFRTGDLGYLSAAGELYLLGRTDDRIRRSGENIDPVEIETVLKEHPAVADAGLAAIADEFRGAEILACVVRRVGMSVTFTELVEHCRARLSSFKVPRYLEFRDELPKTNGTFRIQRGLLRDQADPNTWFDRYDR
jgi:long-chain acyl-CoA synthetase